MTPRQIDAKLAEAIGCIVGEPDGALGRTCSCPRGDHAVRAMHGGPVPSAVLLPYYSAPTWTTSGQLIEGLSGPRFSPYKFEINTHTDRWFIAWSGHDAGLVYIDDRNIPKAVAEAARLALGLEVPQ